MAKVTGQLIYELEDEASEEITPGIFESQPWKEAREDVQQTYNKIAEKINNFLTYGHAPKKENSK